MLDSHPLFLFRHPKKPKYRHVNEERRRKKDDHPAEDSPHKGMRMTNDFLIEVETCSLDKKVTEHGSEITFTGHQPMGQIHHRFVEETRE